MESSYYRPLRDAGFSLGCMLRCLGCGRCQGRKEEEMSAYVLSSRHCFFGLSGAQPPSASNQSSSSSLYIYIYAYVHI